MVRMLNNKIKMFAVLICTMNFVFAQCWDGSTDDDAAMAAFGGCEAAVIALGCDFEFSGAPISDSCGESCCPEDCADDDADCARRGHQDRRHVQAAEVPAPV